MLSAGAPIQSAPDRTLRAVVLVGCLALGAGLLPAAETSMPSAADSGYTGKSLTEALLDLRSRGLKIVFTSNVVRPDMSVEAEPVAIDLRQILEELLAPHGLEALDSAGGTVVVVARAAEASESRSSISGFVLSRRNSAPVAGAIVHLLETGIEVRSAEDGGFLISDPGFGTFTLEIRRRGFVVERLERLAVAAGQPIEVSILLDPAPITEEELVVTPSRVSLLRHEPVALLALSRDEILALPHLGDDFFRALSLLPGVTANDVTAQFHVRGGRRDETQILLDGQELYEAYHLKDFDSALSTVAPATLGSADLTTGGFSAKYGDRMSGVLDMTTTTPTGSPRVRLGVGILSAQAGGAGAFHGGRGSWLAELRRGSTDLVGRLLGDEDPQYWDAFIKLDYRLGPGNSLRGNVLHFGDELEFEEVIEDERKRFETEYNSSYLWLTHQTILSADLFFETAASVARIDRDRRGRELEEDALFTILDQRDSEVLGLRQSWNHQVTPNQSLQWGWQLREFETVYDYFGTHTFDNPLAQIRHDFEEDPTVLFQGRSKEDHNSAYLADRLRIGDSLTLELGLRYDRHSQTSESHVSPRLNLAFAFGERSVFRVAWGRFNQSQRPYELLVEDGEQGFHPVERSEHRVIGFERLFEAGSKGSDLTFRIEVYRREVGNPRPRFENLFEPINEFPEVEPDRVRIAPDRSIAEGVELFLRGSLGRKVGWWVNYAYASSDDEIAGSRIPRIFDQTHSLNLDLDYRVSQHWHLNLAWRYHTGWPTTPLSLQEIENEEGEAEFVPLLGRLNSERLSSYHRADLRASRRWRFRSASVDFFVDVQNVYNRKNLAGFDIEIDEEEGTILATEEEWAGFLPSLGISFEF